MANKKRSGRNKTSPDIRQPERVVPSIAHSASRVSRATGGVGLRIARLEQRSKAPAVTRRSPPPAAAKRRQGANTAPSKKATPRSSANRPTPLPPQPKRAASPGAVTRARSAWNSLEPHHQQRILGLLLLAVSIFVFCALTVLHTNRVLSPLAEFFYRLFGWSAYPFSLGLIGFAIAHLIEGIRKQKFIRWSLVIGLVILGLLLVAESNLLLHGETGGALGIALALPLRNLGAMGHILLIGLFGLVTIFTFQITFSHFADMGQSIGRLFFSKGQPASGGSQGPSPYLGERPQFSRYASPAGKQAGSTPRGRFPLNEPDGDDDDDDEGGNIDFEADFGDADDPENDINIHKQQVGLIPRGSPPVQPLNIEDHRQAVQGALQPPLPFDQAGNSPRKSVITGIPDLEPLAPNPLHARQKPARGPASAQSALESPWRLPDSNLLNHPEEVKLHLLGDDTAGLAKLIQDTLRSFRVDADVRAEDISIGPTVIRFGIRPTGRPEMRKDEKGRPVPVRDAAGSIIYEARTRVSRIMALQNDLALVLEAKAIRMEAPVPGRPYVGVEIPNKNSRLVTLREVLESKEYQAAKVKSRLAVALGKDVAGLVRVGDLARMPHLLIAGATGAGKSVCINTIIASILTQATPDDVRLLMVDPKMVELNMYNGIPHLLSPVVTEVEKVVPLLKNAIAEMERRYRQFSQLGVRNLDSYRKLRAEKIAHGDNTLKNLPAIVIIIDELADLMMAAPEEVEGMICRLAQLARATGIHLVVATQRPSVDVITGLIKANIPTRISFMVSSAVDSRTIIDMGGAERLLGRGDMLYLPADAGRPERIQGAFLADEEAERLVAFWSQQVAEHAAAGANGPAPALAAPQQAVEPGWEIRELPSDDEEGEDDLLENAEDVVREYERASISLLQRRLHIGYSRAARLIDLLEERGIIGPAEQGGRSHEVVDEGNGGNGGNGGSGGYGFTRRAGSDGRTIADEVADIIAEEKKREEFQKKQAAARQVGSMRRAPTGQGSANHGEREHERDES